MPQLLLPEVRDFNELFSGFKMKPDLSKPCQSHRLAGRNCLSGRVQGDGEGGYYFFDAVPSPRVLDALRGRLVTTDDTLSVSVIPLEDVALVCVRHGKIIGSHWLSYVALNTVPTETVE